MKVYTDDGDGNLEPGGDDAQRVECAYDGLGRRIIKVDKTGQSEVTYHYYYNEGWQVLEERIGDDPDPYAQYAWDARYIDAPVVRWRDTTSPPDGQVDETLYFTTDANMNVTAAVDASSTVQVALRSHGHASDARPCHSSPTWPRQGPRGHATRRPHGHANGGEAMPPVGHMATPTAARPCHSSPTWPRERQRGHGTRNRRRIDPLPFRAVAWPPCPRPRGGGRKEKENPMRLLVILLVVLLLSASAQAGRAFCPRVTSEHNADTTDLARFRNFHAWKDKSGNDLAIALWQYLCGYETGIYHFYEVLDGPDPYSEYSTMREPLKMLNVYNCGYCGIFGPTVEGIFHGCGFTTGRSFGLAAWSHCATEIYYDNAWHYFDVDVRGCVLKPDGTVASLQETKTNKQLWIDSLDKIQPYFPSHRGKEGISRVADIYARSPVDFQYRWWQGSHTADFSLRPGESLTRWWQPQGGRWNHRASYTKEDWVRKLLLTPPIGMKPNHRDFTKWNHGNGLFHYAPDLTAASSDFADGVWSVKGLAAGKDGLVLSEAAGQAVIEVFTPFVIVAKVNDLDNFDDDVEASVITMDAAKPVKVEVSLDNGLSWVEAGTLGPEKKSLDLTKHVRGTYGYLARFSAAGKSGDLVAKSLSIDTWVQVGAISLPRLMKGANKLRYDAGDRYDGITQAVLVLPNVADPEDLKKYVTEMPRNYQPTQNLSRIQGDLVIKMAAPPGTKIAWFSVGGTFTTHQQEAARNTDNRIAYAVGEPKDFKEVYKADCPTWAQHWRYNHDTDVKLDTSAEVVYAKFTGKPAVNVIRACLHVVPAVKHDPAVRVTHGYKVGGQMVEKPVEMKAPGDYTIDCAGDVENVFVRVEKPSSKK